MGISIAEFFTWMDGFADRVPLAAAPIVPGPPELRSGPGATPYDLSPVQPPSRHTDLDLARALKGRRLKHRRRRSTKPAKLSSCA